MSRQTSPLALPPQSGLRPDSSPFPGSRSSHTPPLLLTMRSSADRAGERRCPTRVSGPESLLSARVELYEKLGAPCGFVFFADDGGHALEAGEAT